MFCYSTNAARHCRLLRRLSRLQRRQHQVAESAAGQGQGQEEEETGQECSRQATGSRSVPTEAHRKIGQDVQDQGIQS